MTVLQQVLDDPNDAQMAAFLVLLRAKVTNFERDCAQGPEIVIQVLL